MSRSQPMTIATPIPEASGIPIARKPQISIRMPQIISGLPVSAADIELVIRTSSLNHGRQSSSSPCQSVPPLSRLLLQRLVRCWVANQNSPPPSHGGAFAGTRTQSTGGECKTKNVLRRWRFGPSHLLLLFGRSLQFIGAGKDTARRL